MARRITSAGTRAAGSARSASVLCVALFVCTGDDLRVHQVPAGMGDPAHARQFHAARLRVGLDARRGVRGGRPRPALAEPFGIAAVVLTALALVTRVAALARNARIRPKSTLQTAIGVKHPQIAQKAQGFMGGSFNTREFFHGRTRALRARGEMDVSAARVSGAGAARDHGLTHGIASLFALAFVVQYAGLLAERWFFFAQARHPQNLYYQAIS